MAEENDTLKLTSVNYTSDNYLAAKKNEDGSYNVEDKVVFEQDITTPGGEVATKSDLDGKQDNLTPDATIKIDAACNISVNTAASVEDSNLPVTASAVNAKLGDYATTTQLDNKQDKLTPTNAGDNITITGSGSSLRISAAGGGSKWVRDEWDSLFGETLSIGPGTYPEKAKLIFIEWPTDGTLMFICGETRVFLNEDNLIKLKELLEKE